MGEQTNIEWTDSTFNPWIGCTKVGPGCDHCYAETLMDGRLHVAEWGHGKPRSRTSAANWKQPLKWNAKQFYECPECRWRGDVPMHDNAGTAICPVLSCHADLSPARRRVFCSSLADVFDNEVPLEWLVDLLDLIRRTPNLDWLLLTKRIGRVNTALAGALRHVNVEQVGLDLFNWIKDWLTGRPPANVWMGATIVNQDETRDIAKLRRVPAVVRFLSIEPLISRVDLCETFGIWWNQTDHRFVRQVGDIGIHWVIVGGESGAGARPMKPEWVRSLRDQCEAVGVAFLFKQWGEWGPTDEEATKNCRLPGDPLPADGIEGTRVVVAMQGDRAIEEIWPIKPVGKKIAGRTLDGLTHTDYPR